MTDSFEPQQFPNFGNTVMGGECRRFIQIQEALHNGKTKVLSFDRYSPLPELGEGLGVRAIRLSANSMF
jgi:hypothetical protein